MLNDNWVSVATGSEEQASFKHMRKNEYETKLFNCEDERFEIDMVIDSNNATIRVLEKLTKEIDILRTKLLNSRPTNSGVSGDANGTVPERLHLTYKLDR